MTQHMARQTGKPAGHFIGRQWRQAGDGRTVEMVAPSTGGTIGAIARGTAADIDAAVAAARAAMEGSWGRMPAVGRPT